MSKLRQLFSDPGFLRTIEKQRAAEAEVACPQPANAAMSNASKPTNSVNESKPKSPVPVDHGRAQGGVEYRVKNGDKWETVAAQFGVGVGALIYFNFKTKVPEEINWYLRSHTGCNQPSPSGRNWSFSSSANPGIIYIPPRAKNKDDTPTKKPPLPPAPTTDPAPEPPTLSHDDVFDDGKDVLDLFKKVIVGVTEEDPTVFFDALKLGYSIYKEQEKLDTALETYRMKFIGSVMGAALKKAVAKGAPRKKINAVGHDIIQKNINRWQADIEEELDGPFALIRIAHQLPDKAVFHKIWDKWVNQIAKELGVIYANPMIYE